jgi:hypothetical protein
MGCGSSSALSPMKAESAKIELDNPNQVDRLSLSCRNEVQSEGASASEPVRSQSCSNGPTSLSPSAPASTARPSPAQVMTSMLIQGTHIELSDFRQSVPCEIKPYIGDWTHSDCAAPDSEFSGRSTDNTYDPELELDDLDGETCALGESLRISGETDITESLSGQKPKRLTFENMKEHFVPRLKAALKNIDSVEEIELSACEVC